MLIVTSLTILLGIGSFLMLVLFRISNRRKLFAHVLAIPIVWFALNYPVRAIVLSMTGEAGEYFPALDESELLSALVYAWMFFAILLLSCVAVGGVAIPSLNAGLINKINKDQEWMCRVLYLMTLGVFTYRLFSGLIFGLYDSAEDLTADFATNLILSFDPAKWIALVMGVALWHLKRNAEFLFISVSTASLIALQAVISSSKGPIFQLVLFYLVFMGILSRKPNWKLMLVGLSGSVVYSGFSYWQRQYTTVRGLGSVDLLGENVDLITSHLPTKDWVAV